MIALLAVLALVAVRLTLSLKANLYIIKIKPSESTPLQFAVKVFFRPFLLDKIKEINARMDYNNQLVKNKQFDIPIREQKKPNKVESKVQSIKNKIKSVRNKQYKQEANMLYEKIVGGD